jgi:uncharacterized protein YcfL
MKKFILLVISLLLLTACSQKPTNTPFKCQNIKNEIDNLRNEKYKNVTATVVQTVTNGYPYGAEKQHLNQKIKVLELKLSDCERL